MSTSGPRPTSNSRPVGEPIDPTRRRDLGTEFLEQLDEEHRAAMTTMPERIVDLGDIPRARAHYEATLSAFGPIALPTDVSITEAVVNRDGYAMRIKLYRPDTLADAAAPAMLWIHGGGLIMGSVDRDDLRCATIARAANILVASVDYRLAPEHPFPVPHQDCMAGLEWLAASADTLGVDPHRIGVGGASAGGGLAAAVALKARDRGGPNLCFQFLIYPMLDATNTTPSSHRIIYPQVWNREANLRGWRAYLYGEISNEPIGGANISPYASPSGATDLGGLPPAYIAVGSLDLFLDENIDYAQRLLHAGSDAELHVYPGAFHASNGLVPHSALSRRWTRDERAALRRGFGTSAIEEA